MLTRQGASSQGFWLGRMVGLVLLAVPTVALAVDEDVSMAAYVTEIEAERVARDRELRNTHWSPLALVGIVRLQAPRVTVGSDPAAGLVLRAADVAPLHAEVLRDGQPSPQGGKGGPRFTLRAVDGALWTDAEPPQPVDFIALAKGVRVRIGRFVVYYQHIPSLGPVLRALDFASPAFTRFDGLPWFPPDPAWRVTGRIEPYPQRRATQIVDTMGWLSPGWLHGEVIFTLAGQTLRMKLVLLDPDPGSDDVMYLIFNDATNGKETDPACRYLLLPYVEAGPVVLDFNRALNPHCAYNTGFACPLPPAGNRIPLPVRAGEKRYPHGPRG